MPAKHSPEQDVAALAGVQEIFQQLAALVPSANLKMKHFGERYCAVRQDARKAGSAHAKYGGCELCSTITCITPAAPTFFALPAGSGQGCQDSRRVSYEFTHSRLTASDQLVAGLQVR